ncbi:MAG: hypothetical protein RIT19_2127 [Verrucomicrobiota bacterium]|jgi:hypothetical protein
MKPSHHFPTTPNRVPSSRWHLQNRVGGCAISWVSALFIGMGVDGSAGEIDKSGYHLFNPVPPEAMRPLVTDRPSLTEGPYTVDPGHFQIESDITTWTVDRDAEIGRSESSKFASVNLKTGLLPSLDFHVIVDSYVRTRAEPPSPGVMSTGSGLGDITLRFKKNFWGNDSGSTAFGMIPFVKVPTAADGVGNGAVEGGLLLPLAARLPGGFDLGVQTRLDCLRGTERPGHYLASYNSVVLGHSIFGPLSGYVEFFTFHPFESGSDWQGLVDCGITWLLDENLQLDAGCNFGVTRSAPEYNPFLGISVRF